jgi:hypothetical protein
MPPVHIKKEKDTATQYLKTQFNIANWTSQGDNAWDR